MNEPFKLVLNIISGKSHHSPLTTHHPDSSNVLYRPPFYRFVVISNTP
ncbi:MAG: hypothetical protein ACXVBJ_12040 [Flavisolibacter sp.]